MRCAIPLTSRLDSSRPHFCTANSLQMRKRVRKSHKKRKNATLSFWWVTAIAFLRRTNSKKETKRRNLPKAMPTTFVYIYSFFWTSSRFSGQFFFSLLAPINFFTRNMTKSKLWRNKVSISDRPCLPRFDPCMRAPEFRFIYLLRYARANFHGPQHNWFGASEWM